jgi:hypothetical protein
VESALRSALQPPAAAPPPAAATPAAATPAAAPSLVDKFTQASQPAGKLKVILLTEDN